MVLLVNREVRWPALYGRGSEFPRKPAGRNASGALGLVLRGPRWSCSAWEVRSAVLMVCSFFLCWQNSSQNRGFVLPTSHPPYGIVKVFLWSFATLRESGVQPSEGWNARLCLKKEENLFYGLFAHLRILLNWWQEEEIVEDCALKASQMKGSVGCILNREQLPKESRLMILCTQLKINKNSEWVTSCLKGGWGERGAEADKLTWV